MNKMIKITLVFSVLCLLMTACVDGNTPQAQDDEIKKLSNRQDVNHYKLEQTPESEAYAYEISTYLGTIFPYFSDLGKNIEGHSAKASEQTSELIAHAESFETSQPVEPFNELIDLHHSYLVALQELDHAIANEDLNDERLHYSYATLTARLYAMEYQSLLSEYGIKAEAPNLSRID
ncbi:hypothetical protein ABC345_10160 [Shouchella sp. 1P09AA]|uniref:hypothetical protein n=1 Tax=unclassified Shouchella TaxID=2893065 RepID=UPI00399F6EDA